MSFYMKGKGGVGEGREIGTQIGGGRERKVRKKSERKRKF